MGTRTVRVPVNDYGVIGKRVADAVALQDDMSVAGVADVVTDYRIRLAVERGHALYAATDEARSRMADAGQVHNEAIVTPETVDAIRAMTGLESSGARSIAKTDAALEIRKDLLVWGGAR